MLHNLFSCNCKEVQVDTRNELSFQMFRISLVLLIIIGSHRYSLPITLSTNSYSNACLQLLYQLFAWLLASMLYQYTPVQALPWTGGAIWLHALAIKLYLTRYLYLSFIYTTGEIAKKYSDIKESNNDTMITQPGV